MTRKNKLAVLIMILIGAGIFIYEARDLNGAQLIHELLTLDLKWLLVAFCSCLGRGSLKPLWFRSLFEVKLMT